MFNKFVLTFGKIFFIIVGIYFTVCELTSLDFSWSIAWLIFGVVFAVLIIVALGLQKAYNKGTLDDLFENEKN